MDGFNCTSGDRPLLSPLGGGDSRLTRESALAPRLRDIAVRQEQLGLALVGIQSRLNKRHRGADAGWLVPIDFPETA